MKQIHWYSNSPIVFQGALDEPWKTSHCMSGGDGESHTPIRGGDKGWCSRAPLRLLALRDYPHPATRKNTHTFLRPPFLCWYPPFVYCSDAVNKRFRQGDTQTLLFTVAKNGPTSFYIQFKNPLSSDDLKTRYFVITF